MQSTTTTLAFVMVQQGIFALAWFAAAKGLDLARHASLQWGFSTLASAAGLALIALRGSVPDWLGYPGADWLVILSMVGFHRGVQIFCRVARSNIEQAALLVVFGAVMGVYAVTDPKAGVLVPVTSAGLSWCMLRISQTLFVSLRTEYNRVQAIGMSAPFLVLGLAFGGRFVGGLIWPAVVGQPVNVAGAFNEALVLGFLMVGLVMHLSLAYLVVTRIMAQLRRLSLHDSLTGLLNRRALQQRLDQESRRMHRLQTGYALIMLDVDHFKQLNDTHGHAAGDFALVGLADELRAASREIDHAARMGGEEFCLVLPQCDLAGAMVVAERLKTKVAALSLPWEGVQLSLTISLGVAATTPGGHAPKELLILADRALYRAKAEGRNRVECSMPDASAPSAAGCASMAHEEMPPS